MSSQEHTHLLQIMPKRKQDYDPWGENIRWQDETRAYPDCSCGCKWARWIIHPADDTRPEEHPSTDWCVCTNPDSHRCGLLTFEHQGCQQFEPENDDEEDKDALGPDE